MKTHMNNTTSLAMKTDILAHKIFQKHQHTLHSGSVKPIVVTKHKQQVKIVKYPFPLSYRNNKVQLTTNPNQHVNHLFKNLHTTHSSNAVKSTLDNKMPDSYKLKQTVLKDKVKNNKFQKHKAMEHQREWKALQGRIQNCKSLQQRKKDNCDPIVNPVYFIKGGDGVGDVTIDGFVKKVLGKNRPKSAVLVGSRVSNTYHQANHPTTYNTPNSPPVKTTYQPNTKSLYYGSAMVPDFSKTSSKPSTTYNARPSTANNPTTSLSNPKNTSDLPQPTYKNILNHLLENKIYKDSDIKVLYVRLCYAYGEDCVDDVWEQVMDHLES